MREIALKAGNLDMVYQNGFIRYVKLGDIEVLRMINHALRDHNWGTVAMQIYNEKTKIGEKSFTITYQASFQNKTMDLSCRIEGREDGSLYFDYEGLAIKDFRKNRAGFTVLHPVRHCIGEKVGIVHSDGSATENVFPEFISPHQPFFDIREMHWSPLQGVDASLVFEGEIFETEDQRNWTDASYKTYCTPLEIPFPSTVQKGDRIQQRISLKVIDRSGISYRTSKKLPIAISLTGEPMPVPQLGIGLKAGTNPELIRQAVRDLAPDHWRIELELDREHSTALDLLRLAVEENLPVELCIFSDKENPVAKLEKLLPYFKTVKSVLLFGDSSKTTAMSWLESLPQLRQVFPQAECYVGTDAFFTELNRNRVDARNLDGVTYSINPQVHAFDGQSLVESLEAQAYTVQTARRIYPDKKIRVSPVSFHTRWNPNATEAGKRLREPTGWTDSRQFTFFGASWTLFSYKYLAESGANAATYYELSGEGGWLKEKDGQRIHSPAYALWKETKPYKQLITSQSSQPLVVDTLCLKEADSTLIFMVNWTDKDQLVAVPEGFLPTRFCRKCGPEGLVWEHMEVEANREYYELVAGSLTCLEYVG